MTSSPGICVCAVFKMCCALTFSVMLSLDIGGFYCGNEERASDKTNRKNS